MLVKVSHPEYESKSIPDEYLDKFIINGWLVEGGEDSEYVKAAEEPAPKKRGRPFKIKE